MIWSVVGLQVVLVTLRVLLEVLIAAASSPLDPGFALNEIVSVAAILAYPVVGAVIYFHRPEHPVGWIFSILNLGWSINNFATAYATYALAVKPGSLPGGEWALWFSTWPGMSSVGLLIALVLLFPSGTLLSPRWRPFAWFLLGFETLVTVAVAFAPGPINGSVTFPANNPLGLSGVPGNLFALISGLGFFAIAPLLAAAVVSMVLRFRGSTSLVRQQLKWVISALGFVTFAVAINVWLNFVYTVQSQMPTWALILNNLTTASTALLPVAAGIAILRYRLYDIDVIINRTLVYGALTASLAGMYFGSVLLLEAVVEPLTGQSHNELVIVVSTLLIAALFMPLRARIQAFIDRGFYRRKYDAARTLAAFSTTVRDEVELEKLTGRLLEVVEETMQPAHISMWLRKEPVGSRIRGRESVDRQMRSTQDS